MYRVLVCGGRDFNDVSRVCSVLNHYWNEAGGFECVIHGAARGADLLAGAWARMVGVPVLEFPAKWDDMDAMPFVLKRRADGAPYNAMAGSIRNEQMLVEGKPTLVIAFPGGFGTLNMKKQARLARVPVLEIPRA